jgi:hypothetical protein
MLVMAGFTLIDNGAILSVSIVSFNPAFYASYPTSYQVINVAIGGGIVGLAVGALLALLVLWLAQWLIRRQGALVPRRDWWVGMKKKKLVEDVEAAG